MRQPFKDPNPEAAPEARYKAVASIGWPPPAARLLAFQSPDGLRWRLMRDEPIITEGAFDSQNLVFWDAAREEYRAYGRIFKSGVRDIRTATSQDFVHWEPWADLDYGDAPREHKKPICFLSSSMNRR